MRLAVLPLAALSVVGCTSMTPTTDPVYLRITDMEARLIRIERVLENESLVELAGGISSLRNEVQVLIGDVEELAFELDNQADRQRDLYVDLDERLSALEDVQRRMAAQPVAGQGGLSAALTDQQAYDEAFGRVQQMDWADAAAAFESFLASYPASPLRANAQYWLAETFYARLEFSRALAEFQQVLNEFPQSNKVPDALLKIGYSHYEMQNTERARQALLRVVREYPATAAAEQAEGRLQQIAQETG